MNVDPFRLSGLSEANSSTIDPRPGRPTTQGLGPMADLQVEGCECDIGTIIARMR